MGSITELEKLSGVKINDLHREKLGCQKINMKIKVVKLALHVSCSLDEYFMDR